MGGCPFASVRPTYLPWVEPGEDVPPPDAHQVRGDGGVDYALMDWRNPRWKEELPPYYVELVRKSEPVLGGSTQSVKVSIEGSGEGVLYEGETPNTPSIVWVIPNVTSCSTVVLRLVAPDMTREQATDAIVKIAESLEPVP
jgi:hypothetical protein